MYGTRTIANRNFGRTSQTSLLQHELYCGWGCSRRRPDIALGYRVLRGPTVDQC